MACKKGEPCIDFQTYKEITEKEIIGSLQNMEMCIRDRYYLARHYVFAGTKAAGTFGDGYGAERSGGTPMRTARDLSLIHI